MLLKFQNFSETIQKLKVLMNFCRISFEKCFILLFFKVFKFFNLLYFFIYLSKYQ